MREEFNRAEALANAKRAGTVGFALTILQRRLASSPEALYWSLRRRRERLESRLRELEVLQRGGQPSAAVAFTAPELDADDVDDLDDAPEPEVEVLGWASGRYPVLSPGVPLEMHHRTVPYPPADETTAEDLLALCRVCHDNGHDVGFLAAVGVSPESFRAGASELVAILGAPRRRRSGRWAAP